MFEVFEVISSCEGGNSVENDETKKTRNILNLPGRKISFGLKVLLPISAKMAGQNDRSRECLAGQMLVLAGHCPLTGRYFAPCYHQQPQRRSLDSEGKYFVLWDIVDPRTESNVWVAVTTKNTKVVKRDSLL